MDVRLHLLALERFVFFVLVAGILVGNIGLGASVMMRPAAPLPIALDSGARR